MIRRLARRVRVTLSYNSQSAIAQYEPFGSKWQFNYGSYVVVDSARTVLVFMPDGRQDSYTPDGSGGYLGPYQVFNTLTEIGPNHFELRFPDDTVYVYQIPAGTTSQQPFLTEIRDAHGQRLSFQYDADVHLVSIQDAQNLITRLTYDSSGLVTNVADPFGRNASFAYDANGNLVQCVDMGGYWTSYAYDDNVYLTAMIDERGPWSFKTEPPTASRTTRIPTRRRMGRCTKTTGSRPPTRRASRANLLRRLLQPELVRRSAQLPALANGV